MIYSPLHPAAAAVLLHIYTCVSVLASRPQRPKRVPQRSEDLSDRRSRGPAQKQVEQHPLRSPDAAFIAAAIVRVSSGVVFPGVRLAQLQLEAPDGATSQHSSGQSSRAPSAPSHRPQKPAFLIPEDFSQPCLGPAFWNSTAAVCAFRGRVWQANGRQRDFGAMGTRLFCI